MTTNLIERCLEQEAAEILPNELMMTIPKDMKLLIVDPYVINMKDLKAALSGKTPIVRVKRQWFGQGNIKSFIHIIK